MSGETEINDKLDPASQSHFLNVLCPKSYKSNIPFCPYWSHSCRAITSASLGISTEMCFAFSFYIYSPACDGGRVRADTLGSKAMASTANPATTPTVVLHWAHAMCYVDPRIFVCEDLQQHEDVCNEGGGKGIFTEKWGHLHRGTQSMESQHGSSGMCLQDCLPLELVLCKHLDLGCGILEVRSWGAHPTVLRNYSRLSAQGSLLARLKGFIGMLGSSPG